MPKSRRNKAYREMAPRWQLCRDAIAGSSVVMAKGETYLPRLPGHLPGSEGNRLYSEFKAQGFFYDFPGRTLTGLMGLATRSPLSLSPSDSVELAEWSRDITGDGTSLFDLFKHLVSEKLTTGRDAVLLDYSQGGGQLLTALEASRDARRRPFLRSFTAEEIEDWGSVTRNGMTFPWVKVRESVSVPGATPFEPEEEVRVTYHAMSPDSGTYYRETYLEKDGQLQPLAGEGRDESGRFVPTMNGKPLDFFPFFWGGAMSNTAKPDGPPLEGLCRVAIQYYQRRTSKNSALRLAESPTLVIIGNRKAAPNGEASGDLEVGAGAVLQLEAGGDAKYVGLESTLEASEKELDRLRGEAVAEGARMLESEKSGVESYDALALRRQGEVSSLQAIVLSTLGQLSDALTRAAAWHGLSLSAGVTLGTETSMLSKPMSAEEAMKWVESWQSGAISREDLHQKLVEGRAIPGARSLAAHLETISQESGARVATLPLSERVAALKPLLDAGIPQDRALSLLGLATTTEES